MSGMLLKTSNGKSSGENIKWEIHSESIKLPESHCVRMEIYGQL